MMEAGLFFGLFSLLIYLGIPILTLVVVFYIIKLMKERNEYLRDIRDELRHRNNKQ
ncbi:hypothetical protein LGQ02_01365 [Bacillus shivajii]|uniref:hypothetical protein n=1 Tax=Bacillus shivajii TaxID=1983719 RepID=UPI001CFAE2D7|nr:hypothetical protein [Bacillus shivajii]UCZ55425.1 hypothetical protein LGQ02_01365 [Bacillus shivajii]